MAKAALLVRDYRLTNDMVKHFVQLATNYSKINEDEHQFLYQAIDQEHRDHLDMRVKTR